MSSVTVVGARSEARSRIETGLGVRNPLVQYGDLTLRRMFMSDAPLLLSLFADAVNFMGYGSGSPKTIEQVCAFVQSDADRFYYTGYIIECAGVVLGRVAIGRGYFPEDDTIGAYEAAPLDEGLSGDGPAELQIGDFLTEDPAILAATKLMKAELYKNTILMILAIADKFIRSGVLMNGQPVKRVTITVIDPSKCDVSEDSALNLLAKTSVITEIFGAAVGFLPPKSIDKRNYSEEPRNVHSIESSDLPLVLARHLLIDEDKAS